MVLRSRHGGYATVLVAHVLVVLVVLSSGMADATVPDIPSRPDSWTSRSHLGAGSSSSVGSSAALFNDDSTARLEEQASREVRETFGEDFSRQLEEERDIVSSVHEKKARIGTEAGCSPISPLSSSSMPSASSLGSLGLPADGGDGGLEGRGNEVERRSQRGLEGPLTDWLK